MHSKMKYIASKMKYIAIIICLCFFAFSASAQRNVNVVFTVDTLDNAETLTFTLAKPILDYGDMFFHVAADSLSGATAGTIYYEMSTDEAGTEWTTLATDVLNGVSIDESYEETGFTGVRARIRCVGSGTMSTEISPSISFKRRQ